MKLEISKEIDELIDLAIKEDLADGDVTSRSIFSKEDFSRAVILSKATGIFCGTKIVTAVYKKIDESLKFHFNKQDGDSLVFGEVVCEIKGATISILAGERIVLNFIQRMSGIASKTNLMKNKIGNKIKILDTRKTLPGFRMLDKYSVFTGGGTNHRMGLYDMVMIKDNHIKAAGSITQAVKLVRKKYGNQFKIEVETTTLEEVKEALNSSVDIIMLDNMNVEKMNKAIDIINKKVQIEISGNVDEDRLNELKNLGVDFISVGSLTHSVEAFDLSMKFKD